MKTKLLRSWGTLPAITCGKFISEFGFNAPYTLLLKMQIQLIPFLYARLNCGQVLYAKCLKTYVVPVQYKS